MTLSLLTFMVNPIINKRRRNTINKMDNWSANMDNKIIIKII